MPSEEVAAAAVMRTRVTIMTRSQITVSLMALNEPVPELSAESDLHPKTGPLVCETFSDFNLVCSVMAFLSPFF